MRCGRISAPELANDTVVKENMATTSFTEAERAFLTSKHVDSFNRSSPYFTHRSGMNSLVAADL